MSTKLGGYMGKIMQINLTTKEISEYPWSDDDRKKYLGGKVAAAKIIYDNITEKIDPLSADNWLVIMTGPFTLNGAPSSARFNVSGISPQTGLMTSSNCGGNFGAQLKRNGYDGLILTGKCEEHTLIKIKNGAITFENADKYWGMKTTASQEAIVADAKGKGSAMVIGPAGENMVKFAGLFSEERTAGRAGMGAVLGSKNVKGLYAEGCLGNCAYDKEAMQKTCSKWVRRLRKHPLTGGQLPRLGTAGLVTQMQQKKVLATKNFSAGTYEGFEGVSGETLTEKYLITNKGCCFCPIQCTRVVPVEGKEVKGPELEILGLMGPNMLNDNIELIFKWNYELDEWGMDTISFAGTVCYAMELKDRGMGDLGVEFGKFDNISQLIEDTALRKGLGDEFAEGSRWLANKYGGTDFAINVKGLEMSAYEPRHAVGMGLGYATSSRGGCHLNGGYMVFLEALGLNINQTSPIGKAALTVFMQNVMEAVSAAGTCLFTSYAVFPGFLIAKPNSKITKFVNWLFPYLGPVIDIINKHPGLLHLNLEFMLTYPVAIKHCTGMKYHIGDFLAVGMRGFNLERMENIRLGLQASQDTLPKKLWTVQEDPNDPKSKVPIQKLVKHFYKSRVWDEGGVPTKKIIKRLKLDK